jgi:superfamily II RNA helicase
MNRDDLTLALQSLPVKYLHRLARGRIHRHFRLGRRRLIELLSALPPDQQFAVEAELEQIVAGRQERLARQEGRSAGGTQSPSTPWQPERASTHKGMKEKASLSSSPSSVNLQHILEGIGVPEPKPFVPDPWQTEAVEYLEHSDVIVSAPTGSGKTYVAIQAIKQAMAENQTVIYTSPLKALSNTKFMEFSHLFGPDQVGILTGDRRDNAQAPLLVMTTEILRNLFYDAASGEIDLRLHTLGLVILDESQYLADPERGVVWEETIILCPAQAKLLLLSASIGNPQDLAEWLKAIRPIPCHLVRHAKRSVPLRGLYLHPTGQLVPLFRNQDIRQGKGYSLHPETKRLFAEYEIKPFH